jgi:hypothetical protein
MTAASYRGADGRDFEKSIEYLLSHAADISLVPAIC